MITLIGISGSLRRQSFNTALLRAAAGMMPEGSTLQIADISAIPLYNADIESSEGAPLAVAQLKEKIAASNGLLLSTPEYNNSLPGVLKNTIDWLSRPATDIHAVFGDRAVAVMGASPSSFGTLLAQNAWLPVLRALRTRPWFEGRMTVSRAGTLFDESGELVDETTRDQLQKFVEGFVRFASETRTITR